MKKATTEKAKAPAPEAAKSSKKVTVKVVWPGGINEDGIRYEKGDALETTPERARALGDLVES